jgi:hypothetical protein
MTSHWCWRGLGKAFNSEVRRERSVTAGDVHVRTYEVLMVFIGLTATLAAAQISKAKGATRDLQKSRPAVSWNEKSAVTADVTCDGHIDRIVLGSEKGRVVIAVVSGGPTKKTQVFRFPIRPDTQDGFCAPPSRISIAPLNCETEAGTLDGCRPFKECREFTVDDDDCDPFNFYWDALKKTIRWWRD